MSSLPLIGTKARNSTSSIPTLIACRIQAIMHCKTTHHVNSMESHSLKSFIDLSELQWQKNAGKSCRLGL